MTNRREQIREATARHRKRHKRGLFLRPIQVTKGQLDQLEGRGYVMREQAETAARISA